MGLLLSAGCAARQSPPVAVPAIIREGVTSVRVLEPDSAKAPPADEVAERITPAFASDENKLPVYPAHALEAGCQQGVVPVRAYIGTDGNVASIRSIPDRPVPDDDCHIAFSAATYAAVWRGASHPPFGRRRSPAADIDGDGRPDLTRWEQNADHDLPGLRVHVPSCRGQGRRAAPMTSGRSLDRLAGAVGPPRRRNLDDRLPRPQPWRTRRADSPRCEGARRRPMIIRSPYHVR